MVNITDMTIIAILRGITPDEVVPVCKALVEAGIRCIEIPMNSPGALESVELLSGEADGEFRFGAGTVTNPADVDRLADLDANLVVSPNTDPEIIRRTIDLGMFSMPGAQTATECFQAIGAGANAVKLFPASIIGIEGLKALKAILPAGYPLYAVGGVGPDDFREWLAAGITGFGIGSALYKPGDSVHQVSNRALKMVDTITNSRES